MYFTASDVLQSFDSGAVARGKQYWQQGRVSHFNMDAQGVPMIRAAVEGSETLPYNLSVSITRTGETVKFKTACSCAVGRGCKHVVAALMEACKRMQLEQAALGRAASKAKAADIEAPPLMMPPEIRQWLDQMSPASGESAHSERKRLLYILLPSRAQDATILRLYTARLLRDGSFSEDSLEMYHGADAALRTPPKFLGDDDLELLRALFPYRLGGSGEYLLDGRRGAGLMRELLDTQRCYWVALDTPLKLGAARPAEPAWDVEHDGSQRLSLRASPDVTALLPLLPPWFVDAACGECGELQIELEPRVARALIKSPLLPAELVSQVAEVLARRVPAKLLPPPKLRPLRQIRVEKPHPLLFFYASDERGYGRGPRQCAARVHFEYHGMRVAPESDAAFVTVREGDEILQIERNRKDEQRYLRMLSDDGQFQPAGKVLQRWELAGIDPEDYTVRGRDTAQAWNEFILDALPKLIAQGWKVEYDLNFPHRYAEAEEWFGGITEVPGNRWFSLEMGIQVDGERINLLPLIVRALRTQPEWLETSPTRQPQDGRLTAELPDGRRIVLPMARIRPILQALIELHDGEETLDADGKLRLSRFDATRLADLQAADTAAQLRWLNGETLLELGQKLRDFSGIRQIEPPTGLNAELRAYQREGLSWLQFLREYQLGGILADDMGLGKTVQTLAHVLLEKEAGRLDKPALVIAPTSLVGNWQREAAQFTPALRVLALHGVQRKQHFSAMAGHDLIVTTYPLLSRDREALLAQEFHLLVLDEAQNIKNARTQAAQLVQQIKSRHRLCLTGTPMENHLGELWSQFHFLQPGLLGDERQFKKLYRLPIEKNGDDDRRAHLIRRIAPFILRRTKGQVMKELPPKTEIVRSVALAGAQRDLYETVRLAMNDKVRAAVASRGLSSSHIVVLDALLKLRQICCDPRLLKLEAAEKAAGESAKLTLLMDILPEMLEEGRRVLLFSQFTSMLELIEAELNERGIHYLKLTGETQNRTALVERFQRGESPLFLISLKAGGVGLNLTAADTVIHYDPWWNPAVENQATDRAHRIGQDKPVFVYKLVIEGSVEEKIMAMQLRKAELAAGILDGAAAPVAAALESKDLQALFEPL
jgi:SNF2 family DNA or RNA helicase